MSESKIIGSSNTGLLLSKDQAGFMSSIRRKSAKKVKSKSPKTYQRNALMLDLLRATANQPIAGSDGYPVIVIEKPFTPPKWKHTNTRIKAIYNQRGLEKIGESFALTFNVSPGLMRKALKLNSLELIRRRIASSLKRYLGRDIDFWLILEAVKKYSGAKQNRFKDKTDYLVGRPHIHGAVAIWENEKLIVQKALRGINGVTTTIFKQHETRLEPIDKNRGGGDGWAEYITKHIGYTRLFVPNSNIITHTHPVGRIAKSLYESDRQSIIALKKKQKEKPDGR